MELQKFMMEVQLVQLVIVPVGGSWEMEELLPYVSEERKSSVARFRQEIDARRALLSECIVRALIMSRYSCSNGQIQLERHAHGKPYAASHPEFHYNVSHSGDWVVCAVADLPLGVDIEQIRPIELSIAERFFAASETEAILSLREPERLSMFYKIWTLKESFVKAEGTGLSVPLDSVAFTVGGMDDIQMAARNEEYRYRFRMYAPDPDHMLAVCASGCEFPHQPRELAVSAITAVLGGRAISI
ncbi:4'-phosphopantetheinyl transferase family protein [Paenibacillus apiarius]|uniref:4'-phosphopantetheinyl transferase superfamily protein n=1 Tax=Paenibacillus apiarius TaxID=46240 RepID=A0ABT4DQE0_9BACL|nr:4'-phosphopantetheinyl transferase superfamily protein [Paenibacillus apiarius]MBN3526938.1 4'-phosphopantetheinyl transferase superfamily protein [Paenibacillus apiarius]MCY9516320.1 4'-phosphopantetheinyl transferase superfamily protein [Paenibacillus apiarius]MCY9519582.1 4'-phosphopantetheinyl transferase superfamily protein [Paenibacillus apiarius]MCY9554656.1 4'-phosphopantetheinyl transferase superfamily protein [Paenibacillus apiarius]MCY9561517.1 4'-phosphopantetheinyl transferase 